MKSALSSGKCSVARPYIGNGHHTDLPPTSYNRLQYQIWVRNTAASAEGAPCLVMLGSEAVVAILHIRFRIWRYPRLSGVLPLFITALNLLCPSLSDHISNCPGRRQSLYFESTIDTSDIVPCHLELLPKFTTYLSAIPTLSWTYTRCRPPHRSRRKVQRLSL